MTKRVFLDRIRAEAIRCLRQPEYSMERVQRLAAHATNSVRPFQDEEELDDAILDEIARAFSDLKLVLAHHLEEKRELAVREAVTDSLRERIERLNPFS